MSPAEKPYINDTLRQNHQVGRQGFAAYANSCRLHKLEELQHEKKYKVVCLWYRHPHNLQQRYFLFGFTLSWIEAHSKRSEIFRQVHSQMIHKRNRQPLTTIRKPTMAVSRRPHRKPWPSACAVLGKPFMTQKQWGKVPVTIR